MSKRILVKEVDAILKDTNFSRDQKGVWEGSPVRVTCRKCWVPRLIKLDKVPKAKTCKHCPKDTTLPTTKIMIMGYPDTFSFTTINKLPKFKYGCEVRGEILLKMLNALKIHSPCHAYEDYLVEVIDQFKNSTGEVNIEHWYLGS